MIASQVIREARRAGIAAETISAVGSLRRFEPEVDEISLLAVAPFTDHKRLIRAFTRLPSVTDTTAETPWSVTGVTERGPVTLYTAPPEQAGAALVWHTGSRGHVEQLERRATRAGLQLARSRLTLKAGDPIPCATEEELYARLNLPYIAPELRAGDGEVDAAAAGGLPKLISEMDIRGDLHMHSTWSDGRNSVSDMVGASKQLGYEYMSITDHSERAGASRVLSASDVADQRREIDALRARVKGIELLHGIEVDIMHDGSLDFDDSLLEGFDIVLASLHDSGGHDPARLAERYLRAIRHPLVNVITHPANRAPGRSTGYALDFDRLFAAAADSGTALEIDGAPGHLDLDGTMARRAAAGNVMLVVDSDSHRMDALDRQMRFAVGTARRGWIEPRHVLNTRPVDEVRAFVARKRARG